jgi:hypothetical protein
MGLSEKLKKSIIAILPENVNHFLRKQVSLVRIPDNQNSAVSDLFPFRINNGWETHFELLNLPTLVNPLQQNSVSYRVKFIFFNEQGRQIHEWVTEEIGCFRRSIFLNDLLDGKSNSGYGTFACFHENYLPNLISQRAFLAERGYIGYLNKSISKVKGYVHGNLDAIAKSDDDKLVCLGKSHLKKHEFRLQHQLTGPSTYELGFVNTSKKMEPLSIEIISELNHTFIIETKIASKGIVWVPHILQEGETARVIIHSKLNLPRPVVFRIADKSFDVFHG